MDSKIDLKSMLIGFLMSVVIFLLMGQSSIYNSPIKVIIEKPIKINDPIEFEFKQSWKPIKVEIKD